MIIKWEKGVSRKVELGSRSALQQFLFRQEEECDHPQVLQTIAPCEETEVSGEFRALEDKGIVTLSKLQLALLEGHQVHILPFVITFRKCLLMIFLLLEIFGWTNLKTMGNTSFNYWQKKMLPTSLRIFLKVWNKQQKDNKEFEFNML